MKQYFLDLSLLKRNRNFSVLYLSTNSVTLVNMMLLMMIPYQIYHETHSTLMVGLISLCQLLPLLVTALWGGVLADRYDRCQLMWIAQSGFIFCISLLATNVFFFHDNLLIIFLASPLVSTVSGIYRPAAIGLMQQIVAKEDYVAMSALMGFVVSVFMLIGPMFAGILIDFIGLGLAFVVSGVALILGAIVLSFVQRPPRLTHHHAESFWASLTSGIRYATSRQELLGTYFVDFIAMIFGMPNALFPAIATHYGGAKTLGLFYAAPAVGAVLFSFFSGKLSSTERPGRAIAWCAMLWGGCIVMFGILHALWLRLLFLAFAGGADVLSGILRKSLWSYTIPQDLRGRLSGIEMISYLSGPKLGDMEAGLVASLIGVTGSVVSGGLLCILGVMMCCWWLPIFWRYQQSFRES